jgi:protein O-mannosyl-transferase
MKSASKRKRQRATRSSARSVKAAPPQSFLQKSWAIGAVIVLLAAILPYAQAPHLGFIWDDDAYVTGNATLRTWNGLWLIWTKFGATPQYYPLVHTTFWIEYHLWGLSAGGFHLVNVLLHAGAAVLLWRVLVRLGLPYAWLAAALFAIHPVQVESVAWITERKNVLCGLFYFASALTYLKWLRVGEETAGRQAWWRPYLISLGLFVLALLSKTVACTLPLALLLVQWWKSGGRLRLKDVRPLLPFFVIGGCLGLLTAWLEKTHVQAVGAAWALNPGQRIIIAGRALWFYAAKLAWPAKLTFMYPRWEISASSVAQWLFPLTATALLLCLWLGRKRIGRGPITAVLFFVITLLPALGFFNVYPFRYSFVADHFQYLATAGLLTGAAFLLSRLPPPFSAAILLVLGVLTWRQTSVYRNLEGLWQDTIRKNPSCWMAYNELGMIVLPRDKEEGLADVEKAYSLNPNEFEIQSNYGSVLLQFDRVDEALPILEKAVSFGKIDAPVHYDLATAYARKGRFVEATAELKKSLSFNPKYAPAQNQLGAILLRQGNSSEALEHLEAAVADDPDYVSARFNLANTLIQLGRRPEALEQLKAALAAHPDNADAEKNLAWELATSPDDHLRDGARAVELAEDARRRTKGHDPLILITLATAYAETGRFPDAIRAAEEAGQLASAAGNSMLAEGIRGYIASFQEGQPFRSSR